MSNAEYSFVMTDSTALLWRRNVTNWVYSAKLRRSENGIGRGEFRLAKQTSLGATLPSWMFRRDVRMVVYQRFPFAGPQILFDTCYFLRRFEQSRDERTCAGGDANGLLDTRVVAYKSGDANATTAAACDDAVKALARTNIGSTATDTTRSWASYVTIADDLAAAPTTSKSFSYNRLYDTMVALAKESAGLGTYLAFDLTALNERQLLFATYIAQRGHDRRQGQGNPFILSEERGNIENVVLVEDYEGEVTRGYAGAQGTGTDRNVQPSSDQARIDASAFGLREEFKDATQIKQTDTTGATNAAAGIVRQGRPRVYLAADYVEAADSVYGLDVVFGDYCTATAYGYALPVRLSTVEATIGRDSLQAPFRDVFRIPFRVEGEIPV